MMFKIIDIETTGFDADQDKIVEIASVDLDSTHHIINTKQHLVNPNCPIPPTASAIHHIIDSDVANALDIEHTLPFYTNNDAIYVAHNAKFERSFLKSFETMQWICTYKSALHVWPEAPGHSNQVLRYWLNLDIDRNIGMPHRALPDCLVTAQILVKLLEIASIKEMIEWSNNPSLLKTCNFGKHKNTLWSEIPADYLDWIVNQNNFDEDVSYTAQFYLNKK